MNRILRNLACLFGADPIPQAGLCARLDMSRYLLGILIQQQVGHRSAKHRPAKGRAYYGYWYSFKGEVKKAALQSNSMCFVAKAGFRKSLIRVHDQYLLVDNKYIKQPKGITKRA